MDFEKLSLQFEKELLDKMYRAKKECKYNPSRFNQMLARHGGVATAKQLIENGIRTGHASEGYTTLFLCGRLDLTMEDSVCRPEYRKLFSEEEILYCSKLLEVK